MQSLSSLEFIKLTDNRSRSCTRTSRSDLTCLEWSGTNQPTYLPQEQQKRRNRKRIRFIAIEHFNDDVLLCLVICCCCTLLLLPRKVHCTFCVHVGKGLKTLATNAKKEKLNSTQLNFKLTY